MTVNIENIGRDIGKVLMQFYTDCSTKMYQKLYPTATIPDNRITIKTPCDNETIGRICETIMKNAIAFSSRSQYQYRVWFENKNLYLISYRKDDSVGKQLDKEYLSELAKIIQQYLIQIFNWTELKDESLIIRQAVASYTDSKLSVFEHDNVGLDLANLFARIFQLQKCKESKINDEILKGKTIIICPFKDMVDTTEIIKYIGAELNFESLNTPLI